MYKNSYMFICCIVWSTYYLIGNVLDEVLLQWRKGQESKLWISYLQPLKKLQCLRIYIFRYYSIIALFDFSECTKDKFRFNNDFNCNVWDLSYIKTLLTLSIIMHLFIICENIYCFLIIIIGINLSQLKTNKEFITFYYFYPL